MYLSSAVFSLAKPVVAKPPASDAARTRIFHLKIGFIAQIFLESGNLFQNYFDSSLQRRRPFDFSEQSIHIFLDRLLEQVVGLVAAFGQPFASRLDVTRKGEISIAQVDKIDLQLKPVSNAGILRGPVLP